MPLTREEKIVKSSTKTELAGDPGGEEETMSFEPDSGPALGPKKKGEWGKKGKGSLAPGPKGGRA